MKKRVMNTEGKKQIRQYIIDAISAEGYGIKEPETTEDKLRFLASCFINEKCFANNLKLLGSYQNIMQDWIQGLPSTFNIAYMDNEILELSKKWGYLPENATEEQEQKQIENWFHYIAAHTMQLFGKYKIAIYTKG